MHPSAAPAFAFAEPGPPGSRRSQLPSVPVVWRRVPGEIVECKYQLIRPIGRGGMAEVWLAVHVSLRTELAIKFLTTDLTGAPNQACEILERFRFEAQISARLGACTRHIVPVHDAGIHDGTPYIAMDYVAGRTLLEEVSEKGPLDPARLADLLDQIADALSVAHEMGIVHRDLKPSNLILVDEPGGAVTVKVTDFGIAKGLRSDLGLARPKQTEAGTMLGSPNYMSPEQIETASGVSARSDVWALGVMAYEALTDWPPFQGKSVAEVIIAISTRDFDPASTIRPTLPRTLDDWFARALAKDPRQRFASVTEMARSYRAALAAPPAARRARVAGLVAAGLASAITLAIVAALVCYALGGARATRWLPPLVRPAAKPSALRPVAEDHPSTYATAVLAPKGSPRPALDSVPQQKIRP